MTDADGSLRPEPDSGHRHHHHDPRSGRFDPARLLEQEARWREFADPVDLLRPLLQGDERLVVDVGAGVGRLTLAAAVVLSDCGGSVLAVDRQADMVEVVTRRLAEAGHTTGRAVQAEASRLPLADADADAVLMSAVLHDIEDPKAALREARRVLRRGGRLVLIEFRPGATDHGPPPEILFEPGRLVDMVRAAGFVPGEVLDGPGPLYRLVAVTPG